MFSSSKSKIETMALNMVPIIKEWEESYSRNHSKREYDFQPGGNLHLPVMQNAGKEFKVVGLDEKIKTQPITAGSFRDTIIAHNEIKVYKKEMFIGYVAIARMSQFTDIKLGFDTYLKLYLDLYAESLFEQQGFDENSKTFGPNRITIFNNELDPEKWLYDESEVAAYRIRMSSNCIPTNGDKLRKYLGRELL